MKRFNIFAAFLAFLSVDQAHALPEIPNYCRYVLSTFLTTQRNGEDNGEIRAQLNQARDLKSRLGYGTSQSLSILFSSDLIYRAMGEALKERGYIGENGIDAGVVFLSRAENEPSLLGLAEDVVNRAVGFVGPLTVQAGAAGATDARLRSKKLGIPLEKFFDFLEALREQRSTNYTVVKLAFLDEFHDLNNRFSNLIPKPNRFRFNLFDKAKTDIPVLFSPQLNPSSEAEAILKSKLAYLVELRGAKNPIFDTAFLNTLEGIDKSYADFLEPSSLLRTLSTLLDYMSTLKNRETISQTHLLFLKIKLSRNIQDKDLDLKMASTLFQKIDEANAAGLQKAVSEKRHELTQIKVNRLRNMLGESSVKFDDTFKSIFGELSTQYASATTDDAELSEFIQGFLKLSSSLKDKTIFMHTLLSLADFLPSLKSEVYLQTTLERLINTYTRRGDFDERFLAKLKATRAGLNAELQEVADEAIQRLNTWTLKATAKDVLKKKMAYIQSVIHDSSFDEIYLFELESFRERYLPIIDNGMFYDAFKFLISYAPNIKNDDLYVYTMTSLKGWLDHRPGGNLLFFQQLPAINLKLTDSGQVSRREALNEALTGKPSGFGYEEVPRKRITSEVDSITKEPPRDYMQPWEEDVLQTLDHIKGEAAKVSDHFLKSKMDGNTGLLSAVNKMEWEDFYFAALDKIWSFVKMKPESRKVFISELRKYPPSFAKDKRSWMAAIHRRYLTLSLRPPAHSPEDEQALKAIERKLVGGSEAQGFFPNLSTGEDFVITLSDIRDSDALQISDDSLAYLISQLILKAEKLNDHQEFLKSLEGIWQLVVDAPQARARFFATLAGAATDSVKGGQEERANSIRQFIKARPKNGLSNGTPEEIEKQTQAFALKRDALLVVRQKLKSLDEILKDIRDGVDLLHDIDVVLPMVIDDIENLLPAMDDACLSSIVRPLVYRVSYMREDERYISALQKLKNWGNGRPETEKSFSAALKVILFPLPTMGKLKRYTAIEEAFYGKVRAKDAPPVEDTKPGAGSTGDIWD